jgi:hypothetical protein
MVIQVFEDFDALQGLISVFLRTIPSLMGSQLLLVVELSIAVLALLGSLPELLGDVSGNVTNQTNFSVESFTTVVAKASRVLPVHEPDVGAD